MKYYMNNREISINKRNYIGEGLQTKVYRFDKYVLKIYKDFNTHNNDIIYKLSRIDVRRIVKPLYFIYDKNNNIRGYSSLYINKNINKLSTLTTIRLLNNIQYLNNDFNVLNRYGIASCDCHIDNLIYDNYGNINIIDVSSFYKSMFNKQEQANNSSLVYITQELLLSDINDFTNYSLIKSHIKEKVYNTNVLNYLKKEVCNYHTINDYQSNLIKKLNR